jgi:hypothetical protein
MSNSNAQDMPVRPLYDTLDPPPASGWVVHLTEGKPQSTQGTASWAWCKVEEGRPGYTEMHFTLPDGVTPTDPYPSAAGAEPRPVRLGTVLFKVFC